MRALIVFESIFGNTQHIADAVGEGLRGAFDVEVVEVGKAKADLSGVDLIVVGGPTHAWGMTRPMTRSGARDQAAKASTGPVSETIGVREWLARLGSNRGHVVAAAFDTAVRKAGWFPVGSAAKGEAAQLRDRGYRLIADPEQFLVAGVNGPLENGELERAKAWGAALASKVGERASVG